MMLGTQIKFLIVDEERQFCAMHWRQPSSRFGCDRSRRVLSRFPDRADHIARLTVEAGSRLSVNPKSRSIGGHNE